LSLIKGHTPIIYNLTFVTPINGDLEYEISCILDSKWDHHRKPPLLYYMQWTGYKGTDEEYSWISASKLSHARELVQDFHLHYPGKPGPHQPQQLAPPL